MRRVGRIAAAALREALSLVSDGVCAEDIDAAAAASLVRCGARSAPRLLHGFPGHVCISVNHEAAHGLPSKKRLRAGDVVKLDICAERGGYYADCARSVVVGPADDERLLLVRACDDVLSFAIAETRAGVLARDIGALIEREAETRGFTTLLDLCGHGVGRAMHEDPPYLECFSNPENDVVFETGMVLAFEVFVSISARRTAVASDGWTLVVPTGDFVAQAEHTILVGSQESEILTL